MMWMFIGIAALALVVAGAIILAKSLDIPEK
jgi:hypothetical protein